MPSAEKSSSAAVKLEIAQQSEGKNMENASKENAEGSSPLYVLNQIVSMISNKVRNLEKRKNKLDGYKKESDDGKELSAEQKRAMAKYSEVDQQLSLAKEFNKQFADMARNAGKEAKREARNAVFARQIQERTKVRDVLMLQDLLQRLKDVNVKNDFLNERNGACRISTDEMDFLEKFAQQTIPNRPSLSTDQSFENSSKTSAEYFCFVIDGRNKTFMDTGLTYEKARELFNRIQTCGYWEKDVKQVAESKNEDANVVSSSSRADNDTPNSDDLATMKDEIPSENLAIIHQQQRVAHQQMLPVSSPAQNQVPTFNGNMNLQQQHPARIAPMKTTVAAVESQYFNQMKQLSQHQQQQPPMNNNVLPVGPNPSDFSSSFSFLQDSELEVPQQGSQQPQQQQKNKPVNVIQTIAQPQQSPVQQQQQQVNTNAQRPANFQPTQMYPPGLKVQPTHIPVNYQQTQVPPPHLIPKNVEQQQSKQPPSSTRPAYPPALVPSQVQNLTTVKSIEQHLHQQQQLQQHHQSPHNNVKKQQQQHQQQHDGSGDASEHRPNGNDKKSSDHDDFQQQPQIGTWSNETAGNGNSNFSSSRNSGGFNRNNRQAGSGASGEKKFNNYRNSHQGREGREGRVYENGNNGDQPQQQQQSSGGTFFRNNERYNGGNSSNNNGNGGRFENRERGAGGGGGGERGANYKPRDANYRAGSGRFSNSAATAPAQTRK